jgi:hypothetical protein
LTYRDTERVKKSRGYTVDQGRSSSVKTSAAAAADACETAWQHLSVMPGSAAVQRANNAQAALAGGDLVAARRWADDDVTTTTEWHLMLALTTRARVGAGY